MYTIKPTTKFQKDLKRASKRGYNINILLEIIKKLAPGRNCPKRIVTMLYPGFIRDAESATLLQTGYLFMK